MVEVARVVLDSSLPQLDRLFDYAIPEQLTESAIPGVRVRVPLRSAGRVASGYVVERAAEETFSGTLSALDEVVSPVRVLTPEVWALARRLADRSAGSANDILRLAIPPRMVRAEKAWLARPPEPVFHPRKPPALHGYGDDGVQRAVSGGERFALEPIPALTSLTDGTWVGAWAVTFSQLAYACWVGGRSVLLAVPDHRDRDQLMAALTDVAPPEAIVRIDSAQSNQERYSGFLRALSGPKIVVGNRSVVYAPAANLGLIAIWDDGDPLHSEPRAPYVHSRDAALVRQELSGCALILSGLVRSLETQRLVDIGWLREYAPVRSSSPRIVLANDQATSDSVPYRARIPSSVWRFAHSALTGRDDSGPVLVQVARPGYAPVLLCATCRQPAHCAACGGPLSQRDVRSPVSCSLCGALATAWQCPHCQGHQLRMSVAGSARTAEELGRAFPGTRVIMSDGDHPVVRVSSAPALVIATRGAEPIAAGGYKAVVLLDGERMLARESLTVVVDCVRWWMNAAVLSAPGAPTFLVGVSGAPARALATGNLRRFVEEELAERRSLRFPPSVRIASVTGSESAVSAFLEGIPAEVLIDVLGPIPIATDHVRAVLRFEYVRASEVAHYARQAIIRNATQKRPVAVPGRGRAPAPRLRVCFDDRDVF